MSELLSCPFCGGEPSFAPTYGTAICANASCCLGQAPLPIVQWNTRRVTPLQAAERAFIEAYRAYDDKLDAESRWIRDKAWNHLQQLEGQSNGK